MFQATDEGALEMIVKKAEMRESPCFFVHNSFFSLILSCDEV